MSTAKERFDSPTPDILAFRRRKQPASDGWIKVEDQLPPEDKPVYVIQCDRIVHWSNLGWFNSVDRLKSAGVTDWQLAPKYPTPPAPEKSAAEKAWEASAWGLRDEQHDGFIDGFEAGRAAK
jgi:hypothetical protein